MKSLFLMVVFATAFISVSAQDSFLRTYGGEGTQRGRCVRQTSDGGYIIAGYSSIDYNSDAYLIKTNASGDTVWTRQYGGENDQEASCLQIMENGYVFSGISWGAEEFQTYLVQTDVNGNPQWEKTQALTLDNSGNDLELTKDGGFATIGAYSFYPELYTMIFLKYNNQGDTVLAKTLNYTDGSEYGNSLLALDDDQGYAILATIAFDPWSTSGDDMLLVRLDEQGDTLWTRKYGGINDEKGLCIQETPDDGFILAGSSTSFGNESWNAILIKTDSEGNMEWMQNYGGEEDESASHVQNTSDGGYILTGKIDNGYPDNDDIYVVKTDVVGDTIWTRSVHIGDYERGNWIEQTSDGGYVLTGYTELSGADEYEVCLVKLTSNGILVGKEELKKANPKINVYQNQARHTVTIDYELKAESLVSISLYSIKGRKLKSVLNEKQSSGLKKQTWSTEGLPPGIYIGNLSINKAPNTFKLILY